MRGCEEAIATALIELAEKAASRLRERARWQLPLSIARQLARRSPARGTIMMGGARY